ncbi:Unannotated [Lentimonas sp. CC4]|nr:Unannotated [Lentimonas sp. CC4]CAA6685640.1 Unannotated [Lentimonas sp. CC6]CAA7077085.1 Unannotated [Lentimonas sp. CC4]CAA7168834.1 Unannotated [Lentimonas sp. CC21]CAA7180803.1 Unannotated [Lentimonas sp. CC8]
MHIHQMQPAPVLNITPKYSDINVSVSDSIPELYEIPTKNGIKAAKMDTWNSTLKGAFSDCLSEFYTVTNNASYTLEVTRADVEFVPDGSTSSSYGSNGYVNSVTVPIVRAQIKYSVSLTKAGSEVKRSTGRALSTSTATSQRAITDLVESALETMIEEVSEDLL